MTTPLHCTQSEAPSRIRDHARFVASNMSGQQGKVTATGHLPEPWRSDYLHADVTYTVLSYDTPIAWVESDGTAVVPPLRYSVTTSYHQGIAADVLLGSRLRRTDPLQEARAVPHNSFGPRSEGGGFW
jgi:hypothetical protein